MDFDFSSLLGGGGGGGKNTGGGGGNSGFLSPSGKGASAAYSNVGEDYVSHGLSLDSNTVLVFAGVGLVALLIVGVFFKK